MQPFCGLLTVVFFLSQADIGELLQFPRNFVVQSQKYVELSYNVNKINWKYLSASIIITGFIYVTEGVCRLRVSCPFRHMKHIQ